MSSTVVVGNYQLTLEERGLWISRMRGDVQIPVRPFLTFVLSESGKLAVPFQLQRLYQSSPDVADVHGFTTDRIALDARIRPAFAHGGLLVDFRVQNTTEEMHIRVTAQITLNGEADPRWMIPGLFYGNNKPRGCTRLFPAYSEINRDPRRLMSNQWAFRSDRATVPMVCAWTYGAFTHLLTDGIFGATKENPRGLGISGLSFGTEDGHPTLGVEFPYRETPIKFSYCHEDRMEPEELYLQLPKKIPLVGAFQFGLEAPAMHAYSKIVRVFYKERNALHPTRAKMPPEWAEHSAHSGLLRWHYDGRTGCIYEQTNFDRAIGRRPGPGERTHMHAGWQSGALPAYVLLWSGRETKHVESITAGTAVFNKFSSQLSPAGTIFPVWTEEHGWSCSYGPEEGAAHSRTVAEAVLFFLRAIALEMSHNSSHPQWVEAALSSITYAMGAQRDDGAFPVYFDLATGTPKSYDGTGGIPWLAAIAVGAALMQRPHLKEVAQRAGEYYADAVDREALHGCLEDQHLVPSADDCHWALISYLALYELDRDIRWLRLARKAADLATTWRFAYNVNFSPDSLLGRYDTRTRGGDVCSAATPVLGCYGLISYREFLKLAAYTGDEYYLERAEDARAFATQMIAREEGQLNARAGMISSHCYHTDWLQPKGVMHAQSHAMAAAIIKYAEMSRRNLNIQKLTYDAAKGGQLDAELKAPPVMYSDVALREDSEAGALSSGLASAIGASHSGQSAAQPRAQQVRPPTAHPYSPPSGTQFPGLSRASGVLRPPTEMGRGSRPIAPPPSPTGSGMFRSPSRPATQSGFTAGGTPPPPPHRPPTRAPFTPIPSDSRPGSSPTSPLPTPPRGATPLPRQGTGAPPSRGGTSRQESQAADVSRQMTNAISSALGLPAPSQLPKANPIDHGTASSEFGGFHRESDNRTPAPFEDRESNEDGEQVSPKTGESGENEIKYKIF